MAFEEDVVVTLATLFAASKSEVWIQGQVHAYGVLLLYVSQSSVYSSQISNVLVNEQPYAELSTPPTAYVHAEGATVESVVAVGSMLITWVKSTAAMSHVITLSRQASFIVSKKVTEADASMAWVGSVIAYVTLTSNTTG